MWNSRAALDRLEDLDTYRAEFMDPGLWAPWVAAAARALGFPVPSSVRPGLAGTCPTFIVDGRWVIKFFGRLFEGGRSWEVERQVGRMLAGSGIPTADLLGEGALFAGGPGWTWPYLAYACLDGPSLGEVFAQVAAESRLALAGDLGRTVRRLHGLEIPAGGIFPNSWEPYRSFLEAQRAGCLAAQRDCGALPERLLGEIPGYLPPVEALIDPRAAPHLVHADLTGDHLLGRLDGGRWTTLGLIDFGDAQTGSLPYELVALHLDLFHASRALLGAFLEAYGLPAAFRADFPRLALGAALLHRFDVFGPLFERLPALREAPGLEALAETLFGVF